MYKFVLNPLSQSKLKVIGVLGGCPRIRIETKISDIL